MTADQIKTLEHGAYGKQLQQLKPRAPRAYPQFENWSRAFWAPLPYSPEQHRQHLQLAEAMYS